MYTWGRQVLVGCIEEEECGEAPEGGLAGVGMGAAPHITVLMGSGVCQ